MIFAGLFDNKVTWQIQAVLVRETACQHDSHFGTAMIVVGDAAAWCDAMQGNFAAILANRQARDLQRRAEVFPGQGIETLGHQLLYAARQVSDSVSGLTRQPVFIRTVNSSGKTLHRVRVGPIETDQELRSLSSRIVAANLGSPYTVKE